MRTDTADIVEQIYAGTVDDAAWRLAMTSIADLVGAVCTCLLAFRPADGALLRDECYRFDQAMFSEYRRSWAARDPRLVPALAHQVGVPVYEGRIMAIRDWKRAEIYNEFLRPAGIGWFLSVWLHRAADKAVCMSLQRASSEDGFAEFEAEALRPLVPHIRRALEIKDRLEFCQVRADTLSRSLNNVSFGVLVLDPQGRIIEANAFAAQLMCASNGIRMNPDRTLWLREPAGQQLRACIADESPALQSENGLLHVPRPMALPISVMTVALPDSHTGWISGNPRWMLLLFDPDRRIKPVCEVIARDLRISEREAEIVALLVSGYDLTNVAARLHISVNTVRTHLKAVFAKTGIRSQSALMLRVASSAAMLQPGIPITSL